MVFTRGTKLFELSNHLGNVLVTVSDKKIQHTTDNNTVDYYTADIASANDYYPFGMQMPGRNITGSTTYRYGFNGKEKSSEINSDDYDYGERVYDAKIGRLLSIDPMARKFSYVSPYVYALGNPLNVIDPDGGIVIFINGQHKGNQGGKSSYWNGVDKKIMNQIGDHNAIYRDGSSGGFLNTLFSDNILRSNLNSDIRIYNGYKNGKEDAAGIIARLKRAPNDPNNIIETIKIVTHSMGTAYSRGFTQALQEYVDD
jgi:RHS repeat-associated protein